MNNKVIIPLLVAITLGLGAAATVFSLLKKNNHAPVAAAPTAKMVVSKLAIAPGQPISADDLTTVSVGEKGPAGTFSNVTEVAGRVAMMPIGQGQPILGNELADANAGAGLQALLPDGTRAITLQVDEVSGVGGLLVPGCRVDLLTSLHEGGPASLTTRTLVQDVKVVAVGQTMGTPATDGGIARSVTLVVTPQQAETIELASNVGRPRLILRSGADHNIVQTTAVTLAELDGNKLPTLAQNSASDSHSVIIIRGGAESVVTFADGIATTRVAGGNSDTTPIAPR